MIVGPDVLTVVVETLVVIDDGDNMPTDDVAISVVDILASAARASGKFGGVTGVFEGVQIG